LANGVVPRLACPEGERAVVMVLGDWEPGQPARCTPLHLFLSTLLVAASGGRPVVFL